MKKFGKTMAENQRPLNEWVKEAQEESLDFIHYLEKLLKQPKKTHLKAPDMHRDQHLGVNRYLGIPKKKEYQNGKKTSIW